MAGGTLSRQPPTVGAGCLNWASPDLCGGRQVDVAVLKDGSLLISDDFAGALYRVSYTAP